MRAYGPGIACIVAIACATTAAPAAVLTFEYTGQVDFVNSPYFDSIVELGDPVEGIFTFDTATPDTNPDPAIAVYEGATQTFAMGSYGQESVASIVRITNDALYDAYEVIHFGSDLDPIGGNLVVQQSFSIVGDSDLLTSTALGPPPPLDSPAITDAYLLLGVLPEGSGIAYQHGEAETLPEVDGAAAAIGALLTATRLRRISR